MTYEEYIRYHNRGDAGVEERMIASLSRALRLNSCGLPADWNYSKGQFCEALQIARKAPDGCVRFSDISKDIDILHSYDWGRATGYNANSSERRAKFMDMSMADYLRWLWNNPQAGQSPYTLFEGALVPSGKDADGNLIYHYNGAKF